MGEETEVVIGAYREFNLILRLSTSSGLPRARTQPLKLRPVCVLLNEMDPSIVLRGLTCLSAPRTSTCSACYPELVKFKKEVELIESHKTKELRRGGERLLIYLCRLHVSASARIESTDVSVSSNRPTF